MDGPFRGRLRRTEGEVEVDGEERKTEHAASEPPDRLLQFFEQPLAFSLVLENGSPIVATGHQLMDRTGGT